MENFSKLRDQKVEEINEIIESLLPSAENGFLKTITDAMNYSMRAGGKKLRPMLMFETYRMFGGDSEVIYPFMAAIEMIHTHSLIHDDLPAMDNDDYRRGRKTNHVVFGEDMAILAGDALLNFAYETAAKAFTMAPENPAIGKAFSILSHKTGIYGMIGGQSVDVESDKSQLSADRQEFYAKYRENGEEEETLLEFIQDRKTCALLEASMMIGAVLAGTERQDLEQIELAARYVGRAFQIQDDILDIISTQEILGKPVNSDEKNGKRTYAAVRGLEASKQAVEDYSARALDILQNIEYKNEYLMELIISLIHRNA